MHAETDNSDLDLFLICWNWLFWHPIPMISIFTWSDKVVPGLETTNLLILLLLLLLLLLLPVSEFFMIRFNEIFENFSTTFWQLLTTFWHLFASFLTTFWTFSSTFSYLVATGLWTIQFLLVILTIYTQYKVYSRSHSPRKGQLPKDYLLPLPIPLAKN
jgi:hypothetical protein